MSKNTDIATPTPPQIYHLFGIRHHGPGSARMLLAELIRLQPDCLLIEGPPDAEPILDFAADATMIPPVALLVYAKDQPKYSAFFPFTIFSPEWQALRFALQLGLPLRFMDLPQRYQLAMQRALNAHAETGTDTADRVNTDPSAVVTTVPTTDAAASKSSDTQDIQNSQSAADTSLSVLPDAEQTTTKASLPVGLEITTSPIDAELFTHDPLDWMAKAAGWTDGEEWWEHLIEERGNATDVFVAIREAMTVLRQEIPQHLTPTAAVREQQREAYMRETMRKAAKDGFKRIAVVCGAWHVPALANMPTAAADRALLKQLPKMPVEVTWAPWTYGRITAASGYGAGITAPGYYEHLWQQAESNETSKTIAWMVRVAQLLRTEQLDCSSAHVIEAVRLAEALAAFRDHSRPGLAELNEAVQTVISMGDSGPLQLIQQQLLVGERLGRVPETVPTVPIAKDLARQQAHLRLKPEALQRTLNLDLRKNTDLERSYLLHRLRLLKINWGILQENAASNAKGTFHEIWQLQWLPEFAVNLIEAAIWGNTIEAAATAMVIQQAATATALDAVTKLALAVLEANLTQAIPGVVNRLETLAATTGAVAQLMDAMPALAKAWRYGSVRELDATQLQHVLTGMVTRICIGLPNACVALDDAAAAAMHKRLLAVQQAMLILENPEHTAAWHHALILLADYNGLHGLLAGAAARRLLDEQVELGDRTQIRLGLALSPGTEPDMSAAWLQGFLHGSAMVLLHDDRLWAAMDNWLVGLNAEAFLRVLPLLRRTFGDFASGELRQLGERAKQTVATHTVTTTNTEVPELTFDPDRAAKLLPVLKTILGI